jgi:AcrR family transcriptional regulator
MARSYDLGQRAQGQAETRARIIGAALALYASIGPARTTISAIAEAAGVQRLTVYRHFPDDRALYAACWERWIAEHPLPDATPWPAIEDPSERLGVGLVAIYAWFGTTEKLLAHLQVDLPHLPVLAEIAAPLLCYRASAQEILERGWEARGERRARLNAVIGHALEFETWRSLARAPAGGLADERVAELMVRLARVV